MERANDVELAASVAESTGALLLEVRERLVASGERDERTIARIGDRRAQEHIAERLAEARPHDVVLSEEAVDQYAQRAEARRVWIIDPLDGTKEYSQGRHDWAVHIGLWVDGQLSGAVALPGIGQVMRSDRAPQVSPSMPAQLRFAVSRSHPSPVVQAVIADCGGHAAPMGSAGFKICSVLRGEADAYVHAGGQFEWDSAAPIAVAQAAGLFTSRLDGSPLIYNKRDVELPDLIVCAPAVAGSLLEAAGRAVEASSGHR